MATAGKVALDIIAHFLRHEFIHVHDSQDVAERLVKELGWKGFIIHPMTDHYSPYPLPPKEQNK
jgi:hypothetical protein